VRRVFPTVYADGLRVLFSFFVFIRHFLLPWKPSLDKGFAQADIEVATKMELGSPAKSTGPDFNPAYGPTALRLAGTNAKVSRAENEMEAWKAGTQP
jgi:hypothetical protein